MHKTNCMQSIEIIQCGKYLVAYVLNKTQTSVLESRHGVVDKPLVLYTYPGVPSSMFGSPSI